MRDGPVILTGASGGLGLALSGALASPGRPMLLMGRDATRLVRARSAAEAKGAKATVAAVDLRDVGAVSGIIRAWEERYPTALLVVNSGVKTGNFCGLEPRGQAARIIDVNLGATIHLTELVLPGMRARQSGQIGIVSSLAALAPQADLISYSATKAGLAAYAKALRRALAGTGVGVTTILPGFIDTPMTTRHLGPAPMLVPAERAARIIATGLAARRRTIAFPKALIAATWAAECLPGALSDRIMARLRAEILPDADEAGAAP